MREGIVNKVYFNTETEHKTPSVHRLKYYKLALPSKCVFLITGFLSLLIKAK